jgi:hypothetical protein
LKFISKNGPLNGAINFKRAHKVSFPYIRNRAIYLKGNFGPAPMMDIGRWVVDGGTGLVLGDSANGLVHPRENGAGETIQSERGTCNTIALL